MRSWMWVATVCVSAVGLPCAGQTGGVPSSSLAGASLGGPGAKGGQTPGSVPGLASVPVQGGQRPSLPESAPATRRPTSDADSTGPSPLDTGANLKAPKPLATDHRFPINLATALRLSDARPLIVAAAQAGVWVAEADLTPGQGSLDTYPQHRL